MQESHSLTQPAIRPRSLGELIPQLLAGLPSVDDKQTALECSSCDHRHTLTRVFGTIGIGTKADTEPTYPEPEGETPPEYRGRSSSQSHMTRHLHER